MINVFLLSLSLLLLLVRSRAQEDVSRTFNVLSPLPTGLKIAIGVCIAVGAILVLLVVAHVYAHHYLSLSEEERAVHISKKCFTLSRSLAVLSLPLVALGLGYVYRWTLYTRSDGGLGRPNWLGRDSEALFAWHPVLMAGGFFMSQCLSVGAWSLVFASHAAAKTLHVVFHVLGLACMIAGLYAVWESKLRERTPSLSTMHSWVGMATISLFVFNFCWGSAMSLLRVCAPQSVLLRAFHLVHHHRNTGLIVLFLATASVLSGVMDFLPEGVCFFTSAPVREADPALHYPLLSGACKTGQGVGVIALVLAVLVFLAVTNRGDSFGIAWRAVSAAARRSSLRGREVTRYRPSAPRLEETSNDVVVASAEASFAPVQTEVIQVNFENTVLAT